MRPVWLARPMRAFSSSAPRLSRPRRSLPVRMFRFGVWATVASSFAVLGYIGSTVYFVRNPPSQPPADKTKPKLLILGTGWGSVSVLKSLDVSKYNVTIVSPRNFFLFTPLLPSCSTGMVEHRSIMEPIRAIIRGKQTQATFVEGDVTKILTDERKVLVKVKDRQDLRASGTGLPEMHDILEYDLLVIGVGSEVSTYGIPGIEDHAIFMKEIEHARIARHRIMDVSEAVNFPAVDAETRKRLLHAVVVGGGPTGVEFAGELHDFFKEDLIKYNPALEQDFKVTLVEALPNVLPSFSKHLIDYTEATLKDEKIQVLTKTAVKRVTDTEVYAEQSLPDGTKRSVVLPYGIFVWAAGNSVRPLIKDLLAEIPEQAGSRRGLLVDEYLEVRGLHGVYALGDCTSSGYAPTAQVASQQGHYLGQLLTKKAEHNEVDAAIARAKQHATPEAREDLQQLERRRRRIGKQKTFQYSHQGSMAYIGSEKAVADLTFWNSFFAFGGFFTFLYWRSAYLSMSFSFRNKVLVAFDWTKVLIFGRDVSRE